MVWTTAFAPASPSLLKTGKSSAHTKGKQECHRVPLLPLLCTFTAQLQRRPLPAMPVSNSARSISHRRQRTPMRILNGHLLAHSQSGAIFRSRSSSSSSSSLHHRSGERLSTRTSPATAPASATTTMTAHLPRALIDKVQKLFDQRMRRKFRNFTVQNVDDEFNTGVS
jgi:hypothetical protein